MQPKSLTYVFFILTCPILAAYVAYHLMATKPSNHNLNVLKKPLALFSKQPLTGYYRDGYCRTGSEDKGNHAVAGVVTNEFLDFSASRGNDLRSIGLTGGCKWCLCTNRWKEAFDARKGDDDPIVPKVFLHATDESALSNGIGMDDLKKFAAEGEIAGERGKSAGAPVTPSDKAGGAVRETH
ncbi:MAG: hypothetical protein FRX48_00203 [Lasallia pustulata]|uniref:Uncharacterized protein n=1 Tax=Lasallia pustulata TaxID=136370 RepID=A0A1W5D168_9LECA|nr:MAG: hypothetical protein FRX48_00203 [Lasallia pustulata]SLM36846.1 Protein of unknown function DUF2237 [Lasallia pustulata]